MQTRDPLECELERLVRANDLAGLKDLVAFIEEERKSGISHRAVLHSFNERRESLLHVALSDPNLNLDIFHFLFEFLKDDELVVSDDAEGRSLVWLATRNNQPALALMLIQHQSKHLKFADHPEKESWKRASRVRMTPLHLAARNPESDLFTFLMKEGDVHARDASGSTPLHHACQANQFDNIARLANAGVDLYDCDHEGKTFFSYFIKFTDEQKIQVFRKLNDVNQLQILKYFRNQLSNKKLQLDEEKRNTIEALYENLMIYRVTAPLSLQELILSKMPYDPQAEFPLIYGLSDSAMRIVPHYRKRVWEEERKEFKAGARINFVHAKSKYQALDEDRETVLQLIEKVEAYQIRLVERPAVPRKKWVENIAATLIWIGGTASIIAVPALFFVPVLLPATISMGIGLAICAAVVFGLLIGGLCLMGLGGCIGSAGVKATHVPHKETKELTNQLKLDVLDTLQRLEKTSPSSSPVKKVVINGINEFISYMTRYSRSSTPTLTEKFNQLKTNLEALLKGLNTTKKPFSPVFEPAKNPAPHHPLPTRKTTPTSTSTPTVTQHWAGFHSNKPPLKPLQALSLQEKTKKFVKVFGGGVKNV